MTIDKQEVTRTRKWSTMAAGTGRNSGLDTRWWSGIWALVARQWCQMLVGTALEVDVGHGIVTGEAHEKEKT